MQTVGSYLTSYNIQRRDGTQVVAEGPAHPHPSHNATTGWKKKGEAGHQCDGMCREDGEWAADGDGDGWSAIPACVFFCDEVEMEPTAHNLADKK
jgi:hypothetical protein